MSNGMMPDNFSVTEEHRKYCLERGWPAKLPDVLLPRFVSWWRAIIDDGRKPKWKDANLAFRNWIRRSSPLSEMPQFYNAKQWELDCARAKRMECPQRKREPAPYHPQGFVETKSPVHAREYLNRAMEILRR